MRAPIFDQPFITVAGGHVEKVDRDHRDDRPVWTVDVVQGKKRIGDCEIRFDEPDPIVGERRLRVAVDGMNRSGIQSNGSVIAARVLRQPHGAQALLNTLYCWANPGDARAREHF